MNDPVQTLSASLVSALALGIVALAGVVVWLAMRLLAEKDARRKDASAKGESDRNAALAVIVGERDRRIESLEAALKIVRIEKDDAAKARIAELERNRDQMEKIVMEVVAATKDGSHAMAELTDAIDRTQKGDRR